MRQTMEALLFEGIVEAERKEGRWLFAGRTAQGREVGYSCEAAEKRSFGRIKIAPGSIRREGEATPGLHVLLEEVILNREAGEKAASFIAELLETLAKDAQARQSEPEEIPPADRHYEALESHMRDGHRYHPSYKSRLGFSLADNGAYGPEFDRDVPLHWAAVDRRLVDVSCAEGRAPEELAGRHLSERDRSRFERVLRDAGHPDKNYVFVPVHPWQMEHVLPSVFAPQLASKDIVPLGASERPYRAQQSIRTLASRHDASASYIKLALSIVNTSTSRILAQHTTNNAPRISEWLDRIVQGDELLRRERFEILREWLGLSFRYGELPPVQHRLAYGTLGAICRENVSAHLTDREEAWPLNALSLVQRNGRPFIAEAIGRYGVEAWSEALIRVLTVPIVHLLCAHGIALESHAQNIILVLEDGWPTRIIVKDLHDGVRYVEDKLLRPEWAPALAPEPETHRKFNRYSFLRTESVSEVRDYTYDAFFFICMTDLCLALEPFGLSEASFWRRTAEAIESYQQAYPQYRERFELFDLFAADALVEEMTKRRLHGDGALYFRSPPNPLRAARDGLS
ncbi:IucA/IucC family protein [Cohnella rhizosphaerae]|uniref:IucA/IucC family siderophore biosynthesis protein n=1 Tax=Cohnella rhizosphaerae TaxID=1457232 RepID=A0A9X4KSM7_9BACL|nr:IucA/IucC family protein [Cohnella rhizosphaerae]MDG0809783.1 IucA/IucC family siderophore biosynthesis protein [Cohnella rhizosphaerae]